MANEQLPINIDANRIDHIVAVLKGITGPIPLVGALVAEAIGALIPNQRLDRLARFVAILESKLSSFNQDTIQARFTTPGFLDLFEDSLYQAVRALTTERLIRIASLVKNGLTDQHDEHDRYKHLLALFAEMNDTEVLILESYLYTEHGRASDNEFLDTHADLLSGATRAYLGSSQETVDRATVHEGYRNHLFRLGVLRPNFRRLHKNEIPQFDPTTGMMESSGYELTPLGELLLRTLDIADNED